MTRSLNPENLSRPEASAERAAAKRLMKRMDADRRRLGNCCICIHREVTWDRPHCRNKPERAMGMCEDDKQQPQFQFDDTTLGKYRDAA